MATKKTKAELQTWMDGLVKAGNLSEEQAKLLSGTLEKPEVQEFVGGSMLRQEDYSVHMNQLAEDRKKQEAEYTEKNAGADRFQASLVTFKSEADASVLKANERVTAADQARTSLTQRVQSLAAQYGIDDTELATAIAASPAPAANPPAGGPAVPNGGVSDEVLKGYVKAEDFNKGARQYVDLTAVLNDMADEHAELFGKRLSRKELVDEALSTGKTIEQVWEAKYNVTERRTQLAKEVQEAHDKKLVDDATVAAETRVRSELQLPPQRKRDDETASPVLTRQFKPEIGPETPAAHQQRVLAAVAAHNEGRYHVEAPKPASVGGGGQ